MKLLSCFLALTFALASCSKDDADDAPADDVSIAVEQDEDATDETIATDTASDETLVVVEESAAEEGPDDHAILLARADDADTVRSWKFKEGQHYQRLVPSQPTVGGADKIEVAEVFMYSCPHCYDLEAYINRWAEDKNPNVRFVRIPAVFNKLAQLHAQLYYTEEVLARNGLLADQIGFRNLVFDAYHKRGNRLNSEAAIQRMFARVGVSEDDFQSTWSSFEVNQKMRVAADLARRYNVDSVPMMIVNGKYRATATQSGSYPILIEVIDELTAREGLR